MRRISCLGLRRILHRGASHQPAHVYEVRDGGVSVSKRFEFRLTIRGSKSGFRRAREGGDCNIGRSEAAHLAVSALPRKGRTDWWQWVAMTATSKRGCESGQLGCNVCKKVHTWKEGNALRFEKSDAATRSFRTGKGRRQSSAISRLPLPLSRTCPYARARLALISRRPGEFLSR